MTRSHPPLRNMGNFKAIALDYEYWLSLSEEGCLYCLNERQVYIILAMSDYVGWPTRWYNPDNIDKFTVQLIQSELMEAVMSCTDVSILVDQANLNLVRDTTNKALQSQALRDILEDRYDGSPTSINPNAPTVDFGSSGTRLDALCSGLTAFVYQFAQGQADSVRAGQIGGLAAVALIAALLIPGLNFFFIVGASIAVVLGLGTIGVSTSVAIAALTDTDALNDVVCCMRDGLKDLSVSEANWLICLSDCSFPLGSNQQIVADFITATLADNYLTILNILGEAYTGVIGGASIPVCPCSDEWCYDNNLLLDNGSAYGIELSVDGNSTQWILDTGLQGNTVGNGDRNFAKVVFPSPRYVGTVTFSWDTVSSYAGANWWIGNGGYGSAASMTTGQTSASRTFNSFATEIWFGFERSGSNVSPIANIVNMTIDGTGVPPFGISTCP